MFENIKEILRKERIPDLKLLVTDRDRGCLNAIDKAFPLTTTRLCLWHLKKDVLAYCRLAFGQLPSKDRAKADTEKTEEFISLFEQLCQSPTELVFNEKLEEIKKCWL